VNPPQPGGSFRWELFHQLPVVGILRGFQSAEVHHLVVAAANGGLCNFEVTMNSPDAVGVLGEMYDWIGPRANIGAGTVCSMEDLELALRAGATFIVTPIVVEDVIAECVRRQVPVFPGALTPTEMHRAFELGASAVKVFPSEAMGPAYIRALRGPFPNWRLMPTGGVTVETLAAYQRAGAAAYGVGSPLFDKQQVKEGNWAWVERQARRFAEAYTAAAPPLPGGPGAPPAP
jgi:2-dehydro-3-deoxyphosphogluconate aldolase/(4S)-4-hydroxy-2-oxoglutarate aldolase